MLRVILLGALVLSAAAYANVSTSPDRQGSTVVQQGLCATAIAAHEMAPSLASVASLRTAKGLVVFPSGALYYELVFAYTITNTMCIRLEPPPQSKEAVLTTRTWRSHQGTPYQAVVLLLKTQAPHRVGCFVPRLLSRPLNEDDALDATGMDASLTVFQQGMPIH
jgi:hypothetical protein